MRRLSLKQQYAFTWSVTTAFQLSPLPVRRKKFWVSRFLKGKNIHLPGFSATIEVHRLLYSEVVSESVNADKANYAKSRFKHADPIDQHTIPLSLRKKQVPCFTGHGLLLVSLPATDTCHAAI